jgi:glycosyltransferase involved in cell wall biosynthesis
MSANYSVDNLRLENLLEKRSMRTIAGAMSASFQSILACNLPALQCLLYSDGRNHEDLLFHLEHNPPDILYCDGVRTFYLLKRLRNLKHRMRIVVDFDDLISRRMQTLATTGVSLSLGYLNDKIPLYLRDAIAFGYVSKLLARYEHSAVTRAEDIIGMYADVVTLVSSVEADALRIRYRKLGCKAEVRVIPPPTDIVKDPKLYSTFTRFIFIGPDTLPQNKLTIQLILDLWHSSQPAAEIHIFGRMVSRWKTVPGVVFRDYAPSLEDVYVEGSVMFAPGALRGGIKTKVAEAFSFGCAVIGNDTTFEGLCLDDYPLLVNTKEDLIHLIKFPSSYLDKMRHAAASGQEYVKKRLNSKLFEKIWTEVLG